MFLVIALQTLYSITSALFLDYKPELATEYFSSLFRQPQTLKIYSRNLFAFSLPMPPKSLGDYDLLKASLTTSLCNSISFILQSKNQSCKDK